MVRISLQDIELRAFHGVFPEERTQGNTFRVNVTLEVPNMPGMETDLIDDTLDYQSVYDVVFAEMQIPSNLLEHVAMRIKRSLLEKWPEAQVKVAVSKKNPPLGGSVAWATVEV